MNNSFMPSKTLWDLFFLPHTNPKCSHVYEVNKKLLEPVNFHNAQSADTEVSGAPALNTGVCACGVCALSHK